jgi:16S rRNA processing protein RimM
MAENLLEVGRIGKAHGLRGDVFVRLYTDRVERLDPGTVLQTDRGPLEVESNRPQRDRFVVHFVGVDTREQAEAVNGVVLRAEPIDDPDALWAHEMIGCVVVDADGVERGVVEALQDNPASDLLVLDTGSLVPLRFITDGPADGRIHVDTPPGLFDL